MLITKKTKNEKSKISHRHSRGGSAAACDLFCIEERKFLGDPSERDHCQRERDLIATNYLLMLIIIVPTFILLFVTAWKYRAKNKKAKHEPDKTIGVFGEVMLWIIPSDRHCRDGCHHMECSARARSL